MVSHALEESEFTSKAHLWSKLEDAFYNIPPAEILALYVSMVRRLTAVLAANGGHTKY
jgi:hypothetical protein